MQEVPGAGTAAAAFGGRADRGVPGCSAAVRLYLLTCYELVF